MNYTGKIIIGLYLVCCGAAYAQDQVTVWEVTEQNGQMNIESADTGQSWVRQIDCQRYADGVYISNEISAACVNAQTEQLSSTRAGVSLMALAPLISEDASFRLLPTTRTHTSMVNIVAQVGNEESDDLILTAKLNDQPYKSGTLGSWRRASTEGVSASEFFIVSLMRDADVTIELRTEAGELIKTFSRSYNVLLSNEQLRADTDGDGIPDIVEESLGLNARNVTDVALDSDGDGWSDFDEWLRSHCVDSAGLATSESCFDEETGMPKDSDDDGWSDVDEVLRGTPQVEPDFKVNPLDLDTIKDYRVYPTARRLYEVEYSVTIAPLVTTSNSCLPADSGVELRDLNRCYTAETRSSETLDSLNYRLSYDDVNNVLGDGANVPDWRSWQAVVDAFAQSKPVSARLPASDSVVLTEYLPDSVRVPRHKSWLRAYADLTPSTVAEQLKSTVWTSAQEWKSQYLQLLASDLVIPKAVSFSEASSFSVAAYETFMTLSAGNRDGHFHYGGDVATVDTKRVNLIETVYTQRYGQAAFKPFVTVSDLIVDQFSHIHNDRGLYAIFSLLTSSYDEISQADASERVDVAFTNAVTSIQSDDCFLTTENFALYQTNSADYSESLGACESVLPQSERSSYLERKQRLRYLTMLGATVGLMDLSDDQLLSPALTWDSDFDLDGLSNWSELDKRLTELSDALRSDSDLDGLADGTDACIWNDDIYCNTSEQPVVRVDSAVEVTETYSGSQQMLVVLSLNRPTEDAIEVSYSLDSGSALLGEDFSAQTGSVIFAPGETSKIVLIEVLSNDDGEGDQLDNLGQEQFVLLLESADGSAVLEQPSYSLTINNNVYITENPIAVASASLTTAEVGETVVLSSAGSSEPSLTPLTYAWSQVDTSGVPVAVDSALESTQFVAPDVDANTTLEFELTVTNLAGLSDTDQISVQIIAKLMDSLQLVARGGDAYRSHAGGVVLLDLSQSYDEDGGDLTFDATSVSGNANGFHLFEDSLLFILIEDTAALGEEIVYRVSATSTTGNSAEAEVTITVVDNTPPTLVDSNQETLYPTGDTNNDGSIELLVPMADFLSLINPDPDGDELEIAAVVGNEWGQSFSFDATGLTYTRDPNLYSYVLSAGNSTEFSVYPFSFADIDYGDPINLRLGNEPIIDTVSSDNGRLIFDFSHSAQVLSEISLDLVSAGSELIVAIYREEDNSRQPARRVVVNNSSPGWQKLAFNPIVGYPGSKYRVEITGEVTLNAILGETYDSKFSTGVSSMSISDLGANLKTQTRSIVEFDVLKNDRRVITAANDTMELFAMVMDWDHTNRINGGSSGFVVYSSNGDLYLDDRYIDLGGQSINDAMRLGLQRSMFAGIRRIFFCDGAMNYINGFDGIVTRFADVSCSSDVRYQTASEGALFCYADPEGIEPGGCINTSTSVHSTLPAMANAKLEGLHPSYGNDGLIGYFVSNSIGSGLVEVDLYQVDENTNTLSTPLFTWQTLSSIESEVAKNYNDTSYIPIYNHQTGNLEIYTIDVLTLTTTKVFEVAVAPGVNAIDPGQILINRADDFTWMYDIDGTRYLQRVSSGVGVMVDEFTPAVADVINVAMYSTYYPSLYMYSKPISNSDMCRLEVRDPQTLNTTSRFATRPIICGSLNTGFNTALWREVSDFSDYAIHHAVSYSYGRVRAMVYIIDNNGGLVPIEVWIYARGPFDG